MVVLIPWKPVVVWLLLSAAIFGGYVVSTLMKGKPLFTPYTVHQEHSHHRSPHKPV